MAKRKSESFISPELLTNRMAAISLYEENDNLKEQNALQGVYNHIVHRGIRSSVSLTNNYTITF